jgi:hypothetical protein
MRTPQTHTLLLLSVCLFIFSALLMRGVTVSKIVRTDAGEIVYDPDGEPSTRYDAIGTFYVNWDAYACVIGSFVLFAWLAPG